jgi:hypothetical protein
MDVSILSITLGDYVSGKQEPDTPDSAGPCQTWLPIRKVRISGLPVRDANAVRRLNGSRLKDLGERGINKMQRAILA